MKGALVRAFVLIVLFGLIISGVASAAVFDWKLTQEKEQTLTGLAMTMAGLYDPAQNGDRQAHAFARHTAVRVTILSGDGTVIGDSQADYTAMENHAGREEITAAAQGRQTVAIRTSSTLGKKMMYAAIQTESGDYIRLSQEYGSMAADLLSLLPGMALAVLLALAVSAFLARKIVSGITGPLAAMNDSLTGVKDGTATLDADSYPYEELQDMAAKINLIAADVSTYIQSLQTERDKIGFLLDNMDEGFLLLNETRHILIINKSACEIFGCGKDAQGRLLLTVTRDAPITEGAEAVFRAGREGRAELERQGRIYEARFTPVTQAHAAGPELIITLSDVTQARRAAQMRQEFFSNASHELKTPITAIKGNAELLCSGLPMDEDTRRELLGRIGRETDRMNTLIGDIIMLSRIESAPPAEEETGPVDFEAVIRACADEIGPLARQNQVTVRLDTAPVCLSANQKYLYQLAGNLLVNAVKYNCPGGRVDVSLRAGDGKALFSVRNDGEPIPPECQSRVFERFYRVDKGRSRAVGGTGLGLSIVKHVVDAMGGAVSLSSTAQDGTLVTVELPLPRRSSKASQNPPKYAPDS